jgi:GNAT superfamily N-acetyltransferase
MTVRNAQIQDAEAISLLSGQLGYPTSNLLIRDRLGVILLNADNCVFVAAEDEKVVGWIHGFYSLRVESEFFVEIAGLVVDENHRRKGIGKILIDEVINWAKSKNCESIRVRCNVKRTASHHFYKEIGFNLDKEQKVFDQKIR